MSEEKNGLNRREALKGIATGIGVGASLPILGQQALAQHEHHALAAKTVQAKTAAKPKFFTAAELAAIGEISELIIPADERSGGAKAAEVPAFIDLMISESSAENKDLWKKGLAAMDAKADGSFVKAAKEKQVAILTEVSKNEMKPSTLEERFFKAIKNMTIDGYYTSKIGIHDELKYKGNTYLKEFKGCTHPEHQS
ncbi:MAG: gluconate 2-dehydrogenase subunit 3 family protein [Acidobacteria bacterium]|nr:gluconate 2-dehydrogenase subunit 3 family protein [Acidobacteriota bacterium]